MVQPLSGNSKAEGDKVGGSITSTNATTPTETTTVVAAGTTTTTNTSITSNNNLNFFNDAEAGDVCLFTSNEELSDLNLDSSNASSDLYTVQAKSSNDSIKKNETPSSIDYQRQISASLSSSNEYQISDSNENIFDTNSNDATNNHDISNRFSIDSREEEFYSQQQQYNNSSSHRRNTSNFQQHYLNAQSCCCWLWIRYLKLAKWRSSAQAFRAAKMALRRYYIVLLGLTLIIISCLLTSFVISRSVGDLDATHSDDSSSQVAGSSSLKLNHSIVELEVRTFDLIDLIECGKTFAFTKYRLRVKVPKSSPLYEQHPLSQLTATTTTTKQGKSSGESVTSVVNSKNSGDQSSQSNSVQPQSSSNSSPDDEDNYPRFVLTNAREALDASNSNVQEEAEELSERLKSIAAATGESASKDVVKAATPKQTEDLSEEEGDESRELIKPAAASEVILADIVPVHASVDGGKAVAEVPNQQHQPAELAALLALTSDSSQAEPKSQESDPKELMLSAEDQLGNDYDPMLSAASDMHVSLSSVNKTLIDCFIVDIEKRYGQRLAIEDKFRLVAKTRKVSFKKMMNTIVDCRLLTWATLPVELKIKHQHQQQLVRPSSQADESFAADSLVDSSFSSPILTEAPSSYNQQANMAQDYIGSFLNGWFKQGDSNSKPRTLGEKSSELEVAAADRQQPSYIPPQTDISTSIAAQDPKDKAEQVRQASYFNMGISMVSGIVPNTLWCGLGDRAANYSEIGPEYKVDACCRAHDHCPVRLKPFTTDYGLINWSMSTKSHCDCDVDFNECLLAVNSTLSNVIRTLYFRFIGLQCIDVENRDKINNNTNKPVVSKSTKK